VAEPPRGRTIFGRLIDWFEYRRARSRLSPRLRKLVDYATWVERHSRKLAATQLCGDMPIMGWHPDRWNSGSRTEQYHRINEIVEAIGTPLKRKLEAEGFEEEFMRAKPLFALKQTPFGEMFEIEGGTAAIDYDPVEGRRQADEYNKGQRGADRLLYWDYVYTIDGRVHGHFDADEDRRFSEAWKARHRTDPEKSDWLYLHAVTVEIVGFPGKPIYGGRENRS